jgi:hypothetical protein
MLMREKKAAEKQGRSADFENQTMVDEVSYVTVLSFLLIIMLTYHVRAPRLQVNS